MDVGRSEVKKVGGMASKQNPMKATGAGLARAHQRHYPLKQARGCHSKKTSCCLRHYRPEPAFTPAHGHNIDRICARGIEAFVQT